MSNNGWQANFQKRCEAVGWTVERTTSNHFKVRDAGGKFLFTYPNTPGDKRSLLNVLGDAKRAGLEDLERNLKLRNERDRLARIEADRATSEAVEAEAALERIDAALGTSPRDLGTVNGVAIVEVAPATWKSPVMKAPSPLTDGEELLLADGSVVYRCLKPAATEFRPELEGTCHRTYVSIESLRTHIAYHSRRPTRGDDGKLRPGTITRTNQKGPEVTTAAEKTETEVKTEQTSPRASRSDQFEALDHALAQLQADVEKIAGALPPLVAEIGVLRDAVHRLPVADTEILDKAARWDAVEGAFRGLK